MMERIKEIMEELLAYCREARIEVDLEARFRVKKDQMQYLWRLMGR